LVGTIISLVAAVGPAIVTDASSPLPSFAVTPPKDAASCDTNACHSVWYVAFHGTGNVVVSCGSM
jgi:hypothetical protein